MPYLINSDEEEGLSSNDENETETENEGSDDDLIYSFINN